MQQGRFKDKIILVTGGNSGIGKATAILFAEQGAKVAIAARRKDEGETVVAQIKESGGEAFFIKTDVANAKDVEAMVQQTVDKYGRLDIAYNNAAISSGRNFIADIEEGHWDRVLDINLKGMFLCMKYEIKEMLKRKQGVIVNCGSVSGVAATPYATPYSASKFGLIGLTRAAAKECAPLGIRINIVCPGWVDTPVIDYLRNKPEFEKKSRELIPLGRFAEPQEIAKVVAFLCSDDAGYMVGAAVLADGGMMW